MRRVLLIIPSLCLPAALAGCNGDNGDTDAGVDPVETLTPEPAGAPTTKADGRLGCVGKNPPLAPEGTAVELTGYARLLADPEARSQVPAIKAEAFLPAGTSLGSAFADQTKAGRVALSVPITAEGFRGYVMVTNAGYLDLRFQTNLPITRPTRNGWAWLATQAEVDTRAGMLGVTLDPAKSVLVGSVHDCDGFGVANAVVTVGGQTTGVYFVQGFDVASNLTFTTSAGRFVIPNLAPGSVTIKAYGRLEDGGPLKLLGAITTEAVAGKMSSVSIEPRAE